MQNNMEQINCIDPELDTEHNPLADSLDNEPGLGSLEPGEGAGIRMVVQTPEEEDNHPDQEPAEPSETSAV